MDTLYSTEAQSKIVQSKSIASPESEQLQWPFISADATNSEESGSSQILASDHRAPAPLQGSSSSIEIPDTLVQRPKPVAKAQITQSTYPMTLTTKVGVQQPASADVFKWTLDPLFEQIPRVPFHVTYQREHSYAPRFFATTGIGFDVPTRALMLQAMRDTDRFTPHFLDEFGKTGSFDRLKEQYPHEFDALTQFVGDRYPSLVPYLTKPMNVTGIPKAKKNMVPGDVQLQVFASKKFSAAFANAITTMNYAELSEKFTDDFIRLNENYEHLLRGRFDKIEPSPEERARQFEEMAMKTFPAEFLRAAEEDLFGAIENYPEGERFKQMLIEYKIYEKELFDEVDEPLQQDGAVDNDEAADVDFDEYSEENQIEYQRVVEATFSADFLRDLGHLPTPALKVRWPKELKAYDELELKFFPSMKKD